MSFSEDIGGRSRKTRALVLGGVDRGDLLRQVKSRTRDLHGHGGCAELLNITRPDLVAAQHKRMTAAGADIISTNTVRAAPQLLDRFRMHDEAFAVSYLGAEIARGVAQAASRDDRRVHVLGEVRAPWHMPVLGFVRAEDTEASTASLVSGQLAGGADAIHLQTAHYPAHLAAAYAGARRGMTEAGRAVPVLVSVRHDPVGVLFSHADIERDLLAAASLARSLGATAVSVDLAGRPSQAQERFMALCARSEGAVFLPTDAAPEIVRQSLETASISPRLSVVGTTAPAQAWRLSRFAAPPPVAAAAWVDVANSNSAGQGAGPISKVI